MDTINTNIKHHVLIGALLAGWSFLFAFFSRPFEHGDMDLNRWIYVSVGFSLLIFLAYFIIGWVQKLVYQRTSRWSIVHEIGVYILFYVIYAITTYLYYKSSLVAGFYSFIEFNTKIVFNIILIATPIIWFARLYVNNLNQIIDPIEEVYIILKGENKLDRLKIKRSDLVCISNAQNYVEIFFLEKNILKTKIIRSSLKRINSDFDFLMQVHRSHLINPEHFKSWKDSNTIALTQIDLPVSKNYKNQLIAL